MIVKCDSVNNNCKATLCIHQEDHEDEHCFMKDVVCDLSETKKARCIEIKKESVK